MYRPARIRDIRTKIAPTDSRNSNAGTGTSGTIGAARARKDSGAPPGPNPAGMAARSPAHVPRDAAGGTHGGERGDERLEAPSRHDQAVQQAPEAADGDDRGEHGQTPRWPRISSEPVSVAAVTSSREGQASGNL